MGRTLVFDVDGVLANFTKAMNAVLTRVGPVVVPDSHEPANWDWVPKPGGEVVLSREQYARGWEALKATENFWETPEPYVENVQQMLDGVMSDDTLYFVTSRTATVGRPLLAQTTLWLRRILGDWPFSVVVTTHGGGKRKVATAIGAHCSVDDYHANVRKLKMVPGHRAFLLDRPWNRKFRDLDKVRVHSVGEFLERTKEA